MSNPWGWDIRPAHMPPSPGGGYTPGSHNADADREMAVKELAKNVMVDFVQMKAFVENPLILSEGQGIYVIDVDGNRFIDGLSGTFCLNLGHGNTALADAGAKQ